MKTNKNYPPNYEKITKVFDVKDKPVIFTYGDTIYNLPESQILPGHLIAHEATHKVQQGEDPESWWDKYLSDSGFRLSQEIEAYRNQHQNYKAVVKDRNRVSVFGLKLANDLSSEIYGSIIDKNEAYKLITA